MKNIMNPLTKDHIYWLEVWDPKLLSLLQVDFDTYWKKYGEIINECVKADDECQYYTPNEEAEGFFQEDYDMKKEGKYHLNIAKGKGGGRKKRKRKILRSDVPKGGNRHFSKVNIEKI